MSKPFDSQHSEDFEWKEKRIQGIKSRKKETSVFKSHGVVGYGYARCTNETYRGLFGTTAKGLREREGLPDNANWRDHTSTDNLVTVSFAENLNAQKIQKSGAYGNQQCARVCYTTSKQVKDFVNSVLETG